MGCRVRMYVLVLVWEVVRVSDLLDLVDGGDDFCLFQEDFQAGSRKRD